MFDKLKDQYAQLYIQLAYGMRERVLAFLLKVLFRQIEKPQKIIIHRVGEFGDSIVVIPALMAIRNHFRNSHIDIVSTQSVSVSIKDLVNTSSVADAIHVYKKGERDKAWRFIKDGNYDLYIEMPQNLNLIKSVRSMLRVRFGFRIKSAWGWDKGRVKKFLRYQKNNMLVPREVERFLKNVAQNGITGEEQYALNISNQDNDYASQLVDAPHKSIAFIIGGKYQSKLWPDENWMSLAEKLNKEYFIYLIGGDDEKKKGDDIENSSTNVQNLCGKTTLMQTAAVLKKMQFAISHDTGAMHLCYAVDTPVISLFSTREMGDKWYPPENKGFVLERLEQCSFCFRKKCDDNICMKDISISDVSYKINDMARTK